MEAGTHTYTSVSHNEFYNITEMDHVLLYTANYFVGEGNISTGTCTGGQGFFIKGEVMDRHTYAFNVHLGQNCPLVYASIIAEASLKQNIEIVWNNIYSTDSSYHCIGFGQGDDYDWGPVWVARNNIRHDYLWMAGTKAGPFRIEENAVMCGASYVATEGVLINGVTTGLDATVTNNAVGSSGVLDGTTNLLTGASRTTYLGTHGCEIA